MEADDRPCARAAHDAHTLQSISPAIVYGRRTARHAHEEYERAGYRNVLIEGMVWRHAAPHRENISAIGTPPGNAAPCSKLLREPFTVRSPHPLPHHKAHTRCLSSARHRARRGADARAQSRDSSGCGRHAPRSPHRVMCNRRPRLAREAQRRPRARAWICRRALRPEYGAGRRDGRHPSVRRV